MGLKSFVGLVLNFARVQQNGAEVSEVTVDPGGGANVTAPHFAPAGSDSQPLPDDYALNVPIRGEGNAAAAGYIDPKNAGIAGPGEGRTYARDAAGAIVSEIYQRADGSIEASNGEGSFVLGAGGTITLNGVTIDPDGNISTAGNLEAADATLSGNVEATDGVFGGVGFVTHVHISALPGSPTGPPTGPPAP